MVLLRKVAAFVLLAVFGLPFLLSSAALGQDPEAGLPACCRRTGAHHCAMAMGERAQMAAAQEAQSSSELRWRIKAQSCPYCPSTPVSAHPDPFSTPAQIRLIAVAFGSQPAVIAQTESRWRIARDRSRQKRGPPHALCS
jgi:hypothetical protein